MNGQTHRNAMKRPMPKPGRLTPATQADFAAAVRYHQAGKAREADALYRQVLAVHPQHADSLHLLGVLALQVGRPDLAQDLIGRAIAADGTVALYHTNLGNAFNALGKPDASIACYRRALVLKPRYPEACHNLATALLGQNQAGEAAAWLRKAIALKPDFAEAYNALGNAHAALNEPEQAVACYRRAVSLRPSYADAHNNLGAALAEAGQLEAAAGCYRQALGFQPDIAEVHNNLGAVLERLGQCGEAAACWQTAIALRPDLAEAHDGLGTLLADAGLLEQAAACYRTAISLRPDVARSHDNLGTVMKAQGRLDDAIACFRAAVARAPDAPNPNYNLAIALLALGDMAEGWPAYEWRWRTAAMAPVRRDFAQPQWYGQAASHVHRNTAGRETGPELPSPGDTPGHGPAGSGPTLLIHAEQGLGDTIQFCRYVALAAARGWRTILEVQPALVRLLSGLAGADLIVARGEPLPPFDVHCPMQSLPLALGTTLATIPAAPAYLYADPAQTDVFHARLAAMGKPGLRIGLVWAGDPAMVRDRQRSLPPDRLAPLLAVPGCHFVSLQKDAGGRLPGTGLTCIMDEMTGLTDTAALIAALDLVIAADTAVAHLAGALGKPVWLLDRFDPDWRWLTGRRHSPWYPSLRIYRQSRPDDWNTVIAAVAADLPGLPGYETGQSTRHR